MYQQGAGAMAELLIIVFLIFLLLILILVGLQKMVYWADDRRASRYLSKFDRITKK